MAKNPAERQRDYRARRLGAGDNGERRLDTWISTRASLALDRLAARYGVIKREILEGLVISKDEKLLSGMKVDSAEFEVYLAGSKVTA